MTFIDQNYDKVVQMKAANWGICFSIGWVQPLWKGDLFLVFTMRGTIRAGGERGIILELLLLRDDESRDIVYCSENQ